MSYTSSNTSQIIARINVTPIIDVALVLVIILLVTAPMLSVTDLPVNLPAAHSRGAEDERNLSVTIGAGGEIAVDRERIAAAGLQQKLRERLAEPGNAAVLVVVRADAGVPYARVGDILEQARAAGARRLAIATRQATDPPRRSVRERLDEQPGSQLAPRTVP